MKPINPGCINRVLGMNNERGKNGVKCKSKQEYRFSTKLSSVDYLTASSEQRRRRKEEEREGEGEERGRKGEGEGE